MQMHRLFSALSPSLLLMLMVFTQACGNDAAAINDGIPFVTVDERVSLNNVSGFPLQARGGAMLVNAGVKGIIVYRASESEFRAFERNCTYKPSETCARVGLDASFFFMEDKCCKSRFNYSGFPIEGPATVSLRQYATRFDAARNEVFIFN